MKIKNIYNQLIRGPTSTKIIVATLVFSWVVICGLLVFGAFFFTLERPGQALEATPSAANPVIALEPAMAPEGAWVTAQGEGWLAGSQILIYVLPFGDTNLPDFALADALVDAEGRFITSFIFPVWPAWESHELATVIARTNDGQMTARALFRIEREPAGPEETAVPSTATPPPIETPLPPPTPIDTPTLVTLPTDTPALPSLTTTTNLNIRSGPDIAYPVIGLLPAGQSAAVTGLSPDRGWWQIEFAGVPAERGWVSAWYVTPENVSNVPLVQAPPFPASPTPLPAPPTPTPTPVVISDWRGEYFDNPSLSGEPVLVRNDPAVNFNWGPASPGPGVPADNFSVRWTRSQHFSAGAYRFRVLVDDGARLWIDDKLVIDRWRTGPPRAYTADVTLTRGDHHLRLEYFDHIYDAQVRLTWERIDSFPDWKAEYFDNRHLRGDPVLMRNETGINHDWGRGSPSGVPSDNFSARWTRTVDFESGTYLVQVRVDDGVRLWVGDTLVIDDWRDGSLRLIEAEHRINGGRQRVTVEYYERSGDARLQVNWRRLEEPPPQAVLGGPFVVDEGSLVTFDGRASGGMGGARIVRYEWDFNYNGPTFNVNASGPVVSASYPDGPAAAIVALRVTDDRGASHIAATQVTVRNVAPVADAGGPYAGQVNHPITLSGTATDPSPADQATLVYHWDFGDGGTGGGPVVNYTYQQAGRYTVTLTVTDKDGAADVITTTVEVSQVKPPTALISGPEHGLAGETLSFSASGGDPDDNIVGYAWDFGDGNTAGGVNVTHSYGSVGSYEVTLTVTDDSGLAGSATLVVQVSKSLEKK